MLILQQTKLINIEKDLLKDHENSIGKIQKLEIENEHLKNSLYDINEKYESLRDIVL